MFRSKKLEKFKNINHYFFSRKNGCSEGIYKSLNCGVGSKDNNKIVLKNLEYVSRSLNINSDKLILMNQSHSNKAIIVDEKNWSDKRFNSDAVVTKIKGLALGVLTADCVPIILYDKKNDIIGCAHAGWRGSLSGIIENTIKQFKKISSNNEIIASVGPCIGTKNYEVVLDFFKIFINKNEKNLSFFFKKNYKSFYFDIRKYVNSKLNSLGVKNIDNIELDTFQDQANFYSYRRSKKMKESDYGRCISTICLKT